MKLAIRLFFAVAMSLLTIYTCVRIEVFNHQAGGPLPVKNYELWGKKWRAGVPSLTRKYEEERLRDIAAAEGRPFEITPEQQAEIDEMVKQVERDGAFRDFVASFGLLQYIVAPTALLLSLILIRSKRLGRRWRIGAGCLATCNLGCIGLMLFRGYFSALGW